MEEESEDIDDDMEIESLDIELDDAGIDNLIKDLGELKKEKTSLVIPIEEELQIVIHHVDEELEEEEEV